MSPTLPAASSITHSPPTSTLPLASNERKRDRDRQYPSTPVSTVSPAKVYPDASRFPSVSISLFPPCKGPANKLLASRVSSNFCDLPCTNLSVWAAAAHRMVRGLSMPARRQKVVTRPRMTKPVRTALVLISLQPQVLLATYATYIYSTTMLLRQISNHLRPDSAPDPETNYMLSLCHSAMFSPSAIRIVEEMLNALVN
ncbi:hypothetical protein AX14_002206 [Amanita brunnescens Koide BX004]|nr:hypothetical protein AX14_002206 [Amanita brunnescens Koide BX004]